MPFDSRPQEPTDPTLRTLIRTYELIEHGWCQWKMAVDKNGCSVMYDSPKAVRWCLSGAALRACDEVGSSPSPVKLLLDQAIYPMVISFFNDSSSKDEVLEAVDCAISSRRSFLAQRAELAAEVG